MSSNVGTTVSNIHCNRKNRRQFIVGNCFDKFAMCNDYMKLMTCIYLRFYRDIMMKWVFEYIFELKFSGIVEIDESLFGRRRKYGKGNARHYT